MDISAIRTAAGLSQVALAGAMGTQQTRVSELERQTDWRLSTMGTYILAAGATASLRVSTPKGEVTYVLDSEGRWILE